MFCPLWGYPFLSSLTKIRRVRNNRLQPHGDVLMQRYRTYSYHLVRYIWFCRFTISLISICLPRHFRGRCKTFSTTPHRHNTLEWQSIFQVSLFTEFTVYFFIFKNYDASSVHPFHLPSLRACVQRILSKVLNKTESWDFTDGLNLRAARLKLLEYEGMAVSSGLSSSGL